MEITYDIQLVFVERLKELMSEHNSEKIKIPDSTISDWKFKKTTPNMFNIVKIALFFGVTTDYLLGLEN